MNPIQNSAIYWQKQTPISKDFDDYYFNSDGGINESLHVFIKPNKLDEHIDKISKNDSANFLCVNETGFGTGLNFYCTLKALEQLPLKSNTAIYFFSSELFPLTQEDFRKAVHNFPQFSHITDQIIEQYPPAIKGFHRIILDKGRIYLTLMFDDSVNAFSQCYHQTNIWYLDGFSPSKNPKMWQPALLDQISRLSTQDITTLSSFTCAGFIRRGLQDRGFSITKHKGFGKKREMISATYTDENKIDTFKKPWFNHILPDKNIKTVAIIGGGLAGCTTAEALARRNIKVTIFEKSDDICQHASGNLQGALYSKLPSKPTLAGEFHLTGLEYSLRQLNIYQCFDNVTAEQCGLLQLATNEKERQQQQDLLEQNCYSKEVVRWVSAEEASIIAGTKTPFSGLFFPRAGWVAPKLFCKKIIKNDNISTQFNTDVTNLTQTENLDWLVSSYDSKMDDITTSSFDAVIVASANQAKTFEQLSGIASKAIRGQVTHSDRGTSNPLNTVVCGAGYICPSINGKYCFGASFDLHNQSLDLLANDQQKNLSNLANVLPDFSNQLPTPTELTGKVAHRCTTPDYLPIVGPTPVFHKYIDQYGKLRKDKNWTFDDSPAPIYQGLFVNIGHGAKGLITCPLSAEHIACIISKQPSPLPKNLSDGLHPARFTIKQLIRRTI